MRDNAIDPVEGNHLSGDEIGFDYEALLVRDPRAWARFWAKQFDFILFIIPLFALTIVLAIVGFVIGAALDVNMADVDAIVYGPYYEVGAVVFMFICYAALFPLIEGALIAGAGSTPGKAIMGIKLKSLDGEKLKLGTSIARSYSVMLCGLGLTLPVVNLITMWVSYKHLQEVGLMPWDEKRRVDYETHSVNGLRWALVVFVVMAFIIYERLDWVLSSM